MSDTSPEKTVSTQEEGERLKGVPGEELLVSIKPAKKEVFVGVDNLVTCDASK